MVATTNKNGKKRSGHVRLVYNYPQSFSAKTIGVLSRVSLSEPNVENGGWSMREAPRDCNTLLVVVFGTMVHVQTSLQILHTNAS